MTNSKLSFRDRGLLVFGGFLFVITTTVIAITVQGTASESQIFNQYVRPFTLAAAGLGTGHYIGRSMREQDTIHVHFATGFFVAIFLESILFTIEQGVPIGRTNLILPYPSVVAVTALFAFVMHISPAIPNDDDFTEIMRIFAGPIVTGFLVLSSIVEFVISLDLPHDLLQAGVVVIVVGLLFSGWAYARGLETSKQRESEKRKPVIGNPYSVMSLAGITKSCGFYLCFL